MYFLPRRFRANSCEANPPYMIYPQHPIRTLRSRNPSQLKQSLALESEIRWNRRVSFAPLGKNKSSPLASNSMEQLHSTVQSMLEIKMLFYYYLLLVKSICLCTPIPCTIHGMYIGNIFSRLAILVSYVHGWFCRNLPRMCGYLLHADELEKKNCSGDFIYVYLIASLSLEQLYSLILFATILANFRKKAQAVSSVSLQNLYLKAT